MTDRQGFCYSDDSLQEDLDLPSEFLVDRSLIPVDMEQLVICHPSLYFCHDMA